MKLKLTVDSLDEVDAAFQSLYTEKDGKFVLTEVEGMKTQDDIDRLQSALTKERNDHRQTKEKYRVLGDRDPEEIIEQLDKIPELEASAGSGDNGEKVDQLVQAKLQAKLAPVERERDQLKEKVGEYEEKVQTFEQKEKTRKIHDKVREAGTKAQLLPEAMDDALMYAERVFDLDESGNVVTKDDVGVTPGVDPQVWITDMQSKRPHWWGPSSGGNASGNRGGGTGGKNPFSAEHWNLTEQGKAYQENPTVAQQMAEAAGTSIGGPKPEPKK